jgi:hypothetical protein
MLHLLFFQERDVPVDQFIQYKRAQCTCFERCFLIFDGEITIIIQLIWVKMPVMFNKCIGRGSHTCR